MSDTAWSCVAKGPSASIVVIDQQQSKLYAIKPQNNALHQYSFDSDKWTQNRISYEPGSVGFLCPYNNYSCKSRDHVTTINTQTNSIYLINCIGIMYEIKINNNGEGHYESITSIVKIGRGSKAIMIDKEVHLFGRNAVNGHFKYNTKFKEFETVKRFLSTTQYSGFDGMSMVKIRNKLIFFGVSLVYATANYICEYDIDKHEFRPLFTVHMPKGGLRYFGCTAVLQGKYAVLFGGKMTKGDEITDDIWIYSFDDKVFEKSQMKCPRKGKYQAISIHDSNKDELVTVGFIRNSWNECKMSYHLFPPQYLMRIINRYYWREYVYLIDADSGDHWKIDIFDILQP